MGLNGGDVDALVSVCTEGQHLEELLQVRVLPIRGPSHTWKYRWCRQEVPDSVQSADWIPPIQA